MRFLRDVSRWGCVSSVNLYSTDYGVCSKISDVTGERIQCSPKVVARMP